MSINKVILIGRLGQEPELKYTPSGTSVCNFSLATTESWSDKAGQRQERTEWHRVVVWGKLAELCNQYLAKGRQCFVEGALQTRSWDGQDGSKRYTTEIVAKNVQFLGGPSANAGQGPEAPQHEYQQSGPAHDFGGGAPAQRSNVMNQDYNIQTDASFTADDIPF